MSNTNYIIMGRFGSVYGVKGWIRVHSYTDPITNLLDYPHWFVEHTKQWQPLNIEASKTHGDGLIIKLSDIDDRDEVRRYTNDYIAIPKQDLPKLEPGEYYYHDLIELTVVTKDGIELGRIIDVFNTGSNDVFVVQNGRERLIPRTKDVVLEINLEQQQITVDWDPEF